MVFQTLFLSPSTIPAEHVFPPECIASAKPNIILKPSHFNLPFNTHLVPLKPSLEVLIGIMDFASLQLNHSRLAPFFPLEEKVW